MGGLPAFVWRNNFLAKVKKNDFAKIVFERDHQRKIKKQGKSYSTEKYLCQSTLLQNNFW
jgi:hypothetical protein